MPLNGSLNFYFYIYFLFLKREVLNLNKSMVKIELRSLLQLILIEILWYVEVEENLARNNFGRNSLLELVLDNSNAKY